MIKASERLARKIKVEWKSEARETLKPNGRLECVEDQNARKTSRLEDQPILRMDEVDLQ